MVVNIASHKIIEYVIPATPPTEYAIFIIGISLKNIASPPRKIESKIKATNKTTSELEITDAIPICFLFIYSLDFDIINIFVKVFMQAYKILYISADAKLKFMFDGDTDSVGVLLAKVNKITTIKAMIDGIIIFVIL